MRNLIQTFTFVFLLIGLVSCDEGRIPEQTVTVERGGRVMKLTGSFSGINEWTGGYSVVVAGFSEDSEYALVTKSLPINQADGTEVNLTLSGISDAVTSLKLCVVNRLRECIIDFNSIEDEELAAINDTIKMDVGTLDVGMYSAIQSQVFNKKCIACHGSTGSAAAGLFLTQEKSYGMLVNHAAKVDPDKIRVIPGDAEESFLHLVLNEEGHTSMHHVDLFSADEQSLLALIDEWIDGGANE